jgi:hypothetical protein
MSLNCQRILPITTKLISADESQVGFIIVILSGKFILESLTIPVSLRAVTENIF